MEGTAPARGLKGYLGALAATVLFPLLWMRAVRLARRHSDADPRAVAKVGLAILVGAGLALGGAIVALGIQAAAVDGMYDSLDTRLAATTGESEYQDNLATVATAEGALPKIEANLANETGAGNQAKMAELRQALNDTRRQLAEAQARAVELEPNHALYGRLQEHVADQDDDAIRDEVADAGLDDPAGMEAGTEAALGVKDASIEDMRLFYWLFVWPSLAGVFFAPLAFAFGSILKRAFVESDTVGFRPYPGAAAGLFLLLGAFGLPAIPFAAWVFMDAENRSAEGQIAL